MVVTKVQTNVDKAYYNGSYGINASWTVWNGNKNHNQVKLDQLSVDEARLDSATTANSIQEQIAQLFVQILYSKDAVDVNKATLETSKANEARGKEFVKVGSMSKADLAQLTAQRAQDEYAVVQAESSLREYKRQLKQLLQITSEEEFDVVVRRLRPMRWPWQQCPAFRLSMRVHWPTGRRYSVLQQPSRPVTCS